MTSKTSFRWFQLIASLTIGLLCGIAYDHTISLDPSPAHVNDKSLTTKSTTAVISNRDCGVYYYYHVGKTGGSSVFNWQRDIARKSQGGIKFNRWVYLSEYKQGVWKKDLDHKIMPEIQNMIHNGNTTRHSWYSLEQHHRTPGLRTMIPLLRKWRQQLEAQGCRLVTAVTLRSPQSWIESLVTYNEIELPKIESYVLNTIEGQARYLLYNFFQKYNGTEMSIQTPLVTGDSGHDLTDQELREVIGYLRNDFDIVGQTSNLGEFFHQSLRLTGWWVHLVRNAGRHDNKSYKRSFNSSSIQAAMEESVQQDKVLWQQIFG